MLTCIACSSKQHNGRSVFEHEEDDTSAALPANSAIKALTSQIKDIAVKASGAYNSCKPCSGLSNHNRTSGYQRGCDYSTPRVWGKEMEARLKGLSSCGSTPASYSGRVDSVKFTKEDEGKEWVAQVEPGVLITFQSLPQGGNDLKRIRFSREMFNKRLAQRWWAENCDKVMELHNVKRFNHEAAPPRSEDESSKIGSFDNSPMTPRNFYQKQGCNDSSGPGSTPGLSSISEAKTETSSSTSSREEEDDDDDHSDVSMSNASDLETEWVEQDEPGVYITIRQLPGGKRELRRVRFSRDKFGEMNARMWWEQNKGRIQEQYL